MKAFDYQPLFNKSTLSNGVRILTEHHPNTRATSVGFFIHLGSRDEPSNMLGAAHFLEHLVFKGTKSKSAYEIVKAFEAVGGEVNAYTTKEYTCFYAETLRENTSISLDVLSDLILNALNNKEDFDKEKLVIEQEIDMTADDIEETVFDLAFEKTYQGHPLSRPILGTVESLNSIERDDLHQFYLDAYCGVNLTVVVAGDVDHDKVVDSLSKKLESKNSHFEKAKHTQPSWSNFSQVISKPSEQIHSLVTLPASSYYDEYRFESYIVNSILGGGMTSKIYQRIREEEALAYSTYSYHHSFIDSALMMIYAGSNEASVPRIFQIIKEELDSLKDSKIKEEDLAFYKQQVIGQIVMGCDDIENRMNSVALNEIVFSEYRDVDQTIDKINNISIASLEEYVKKFHKEEKLNWLVMGDIKNDSLGDQLSQLF